jgi:hypothetical protein
LWEHTIFSMAGDKYWHNFFSESQYHSCKICFRISSHVYWTSAAIWSTHILEILSSLKLLWFFWIFWCNNKFIAQNGTDIFFNWWQVC